MKIFLGSDHAGYLLKEAVKKYLKDLGYTVEDEGAFGLLSDDDYPDFVHIVAQQVAADPENSFGIVFGASGQGEAMVANRYKGVRAAVYYGGVEDELILSRDHNNANVLSLGARFLKDEEAIKAVKLWLETSFTGGERHLRRIAKIDK